MSYEKMKALQSLATKQGLNIKTIKEFIEFAKTVKL